ncbi:MAG TPA: hypothetical protein V6C86_25450 [Oculatellaceae cyanobacterium]
MFIFKRVEAHTLHMLSGEPKVDDFAYFLKRSRITPATTFRFGWYAPDAVSRYEVEMEYSNSGKATWHVVLDDGKKRATVWEQTTNDALLIYNLVNASCTVGRGVHAVFPMLNNRWAI